MYKLNTEGGSGGVEYFSQLKLKSGVLRPITYLHTGLMAAAWIILLSFTSSSLQAQCDDPMLVTVSCDPVLCHGDANGYAEGRIYGGTPPYTVTLSGPMTTTITVAEYSGSFEFTGLIAGTYTVTAWDANYDYKNKEGCKASATALIGEPPLLELEVNGDTLSCTATEGTVSGLVSGGTAPYKVRLSGDAEASVTVSESGESFEFTGLGEGNYTITVTDTYYLNNLGAGCKITGDASIITGGASSEPVEMDTTICEGNGYSFGGQTLTTSGVYRDTLANVNGCDSILVLTLTVTEQIKIDTIVAICEGDSYEFNGELLMIPGTYQDTVLSDVSCDTLLTVILEFTDIIEVERRVTICEGDSYEFNGELLTMPGTYQDTVLSDVSCDTLLTVILETTDIIEVERRVTICEGDSYEFNGELLTMPGTYQDTVLSDVSCDTLLTVILEFTDIIEVERRVTICEGDSYEFNGELLTMPGTYQDTVLSDVSCDTLLTVILEFTDIIEVERRVTICEGDSYEFNGELLTMPGTYQDTVLSDVSCDTLLTVILEFTDIIEVERRVTICEGDSYTFNGELLTMPGTYQDTVLSDVSCDTLLTVILEFTDIIEVERRVTICEGDSYEFNGELLTMPGTYQDTVLSDVSCDTLLTVILEFTDIIEVERRVTICEGDSYEFNGELLTMPGTYQDTVLSDVSCDTLLTVILEFTDIIEVERRVTICEGDSYEFNGELLTMPGTYQDTVLSDVSCDTLLTVILEFTDIIEVERRVTICEGDSYEFNGELLTMAGTYQDTVLSDVSCDTLLTVILEFTDIIEVERRVTICEGDSYEFNGELLTMPGTYQDTVLSDVSCDTLLTVILEFTDIIEVERRVTICEGDSYTFNGELLTMPGTYQDTVLSDVSCDTLLTVILEFTDIIEVERRVTICEGDSYTFNGELLTMPGTYQDTVLSDVSCDTLLTVILEFTDIIEVERRVTICEGDSYEFNGELLTMPGTYQDTILSDVSCDTLLTVILEFTDIIEVERRVAICEGDSYTFNGELLTMPGTYQDTVLSDVSCDTLLTVILEFTDIIEVERRVTICEGDSYTFNGELLTMPGTYQDTVLSDVSCDTLLTVILEFTDIIEVERRVTICEGDSYEFNGELLTMPGTYQDTVLSDVSCDTLLTVILEFTDIIEVERRVTICEGDSYEFNGELLTIPGTYQDTVLSDVSCDTLLTVILEFTDIIEVERRVTICESDSYEFNGELLTTPGTYQDTVLSDVSCDTLLTVILEFTDIIEVERRVTICEGDSYEFNSELLTTPGTYQDTVLSDVSCDTLLTVILEFTDIIEVERRVTICEGDSYEFNGELLTTPGTYQDTVLSDVSCDTLLTVILEFTDIIEVERRVTICEGDSYEFNGELLTTPGTYQDTVLSDVSCDTLLTVILEFTDIIEVERRVTICEGDSYEFNGELLTMPGTYQDTVLSDVSCDTLLTVILEFTDIIEVERRVTICEGDSYTFNGELLTIPGTYQDTVLSDVSCDTLLTVILEFTDIIEVERQVTICEGDSYEFNGELLTMPGTYQDTVLSDVSCDTLLTVILEFTDIIEVERRVAICEGDSYTFNGELLTIPGTYQDTILSDVSCDTLLTVILEFTDIIEVERRVTICEGDSYTFNGELLTMPGTYQDTVLSDVSCDTLLTVILEFTDIIEVERRVTICEGDSYEFNGELLTMPGTYQDTVLSDVSCDTLLTVILEFTDIIEVERRVTICEGDSYEFNGELLTTPGTYQDTVLSDVSCDTLLTVILETTDIIEVERRVTICEGDSYEFNGELLTMPGTYQDTVLSDVSCDTLLTVILEFTDIIEVERRVTICEGDSYTFNGELLTMPGTYQDTVLSDVSCDTLLTVILEFTDIIEVERRDTICEGESYPFNGELLTMAGTYQDTVLSDVSCDTLLTLILTINPTPDATLSPTDTVLCVIPDNFLLTVTNNDTTQTLSYEWTPDFAILSDPSDVPSVLVDLLESTTFSVYLTNQYDCRDTLTVNFPSVVCPDNLTITSDPNPAVICPGESVTLSVESDCIDCTYEWTSTAGDTLSGTNITVNPEVTTTYSVVAITAEGCRCESGDEITVVVDCPCNTDGIFIPSAFTPNNDMVNDELCVRATSGTDTSELSMVLTIYNRWGEAVFTTDNFGDCWDGTYKGAALPEDVYVYTLLLTCPGEAPVQKIGDVILLR